MSFRDELWNSIRDVYGAILAHPFIKGLVDGSLPIDVFQYYIIQDALYLSEFSRAIALTGAKAPTDDVAAELFSNARNALLLERASLHEFLMSEWGMKPEDVYSKPMNMANMGYTNYLLFVTYSKPFHEAMAAILPCFWVYWEVGEELLKKGSSRQTYKKWIDTYSSEEYAKVVKKTISIMEDEAGKLTGQEREKVKRHFRLSTIYEYLFWDAANTKEVWPFEL